MRNRTTTMLLCATILGALAWIGLPAGAVQGGGEASLGSGGKQRGKTWSCQGTSSVTQCLSCCMDEAALLQSYCLSFGCSESFCMRVAYDYLGLCESHACGIN